MTPLSVRKSMPMLSSGPPWSISAKNPMAATIAGITNGIEINERIIEICFHSYRPSCQASGKPMINVKITENKDSIMVKYNASLASLRLKKEIIESNELVPVTDSKRIMA
jgi:hypothetical protein